MDSNLIVNFPEEYFLYCFDIVFLQMVILTGVREQPAVGPTTSNPFLGLSAWNEIGLRQNDHDGGDRLNAVTETLLNGVLEQRLGLATR
jgi:hypothetical protein